MRIAQKEGFCFNRGKYAINSFGAIYDQNGMHPDPSKVTEMKMLPSPLNTIDLQRVLGIITYMPPFIPHLSDVTAPLRDLKKEVEYQWTENHQRPSSKSRISFAKICCCRTSQQTVIWVDA